MSATRLAKLSRFSLAGVILLCLTFSCQNQTAKAELEQMRAKAEIEAQNKAIVNQLLKRMDKGNFGVFNELFAAESRIYLPGSSEPLTHEVFSQLAPLFYGAFPNYTHTIEDIIAEGDKVVVRCTCRGTQKGEFKGIPPTGKDFEYGEIIIFRLTDGKIEEVWVQEDELWMMQQLGMELKPKEAK